MINCCIKDGLKEQLIGEFCGVSNFKLQNTNITENGESGELYKAFKSHIRFTEDYLNEYYSSKYAKHFFTPSQRKFTIAKWLRS